MWLWTINSRHEPKYLVPNLTIRLCNGPLQNLWQGIIWTYIPPCFSSSFAMLTLCPNEAFPCSTAEIGLKKEKLGIEGIGEEKSATLDLQQLLKEKPPYPEQGVPSSARKAENDDLQVNAGDCSSWPSPKLQSIFLEINVAEKELPPASSCLQQRSSCLHGFCATCSHSSIQEWAAKVNYIVSLGLEIWKTHLLWHPKITLQ